MNHLSTSYNSTSDTPESKIKGTPMANHPGYFYTFDLDGKLTVTHETGDALTKQLPKFHWNFAAEADSMAKQHETTKGNNIDQTPMQVAQAAQKVTGGSRRDATELLN